MDQTNFNFDYLSPTGSVGIIVLIIGVLFTGMTFYVFYKVANNDDSIKDQERKESLKRAQKEKIAKLYPKGTNL